MDDKGNQYMQNSDWNFSHKKPQRSLVTIIVMLTVAPFVLLRLGDKLPLNLTAVALVSEMNPRPNYLSIVCSDRKEMTPQIISTERYAFLQGYTYLNNGQCNNALSSWESVIQEDNSNDIAAFMLGVLYFKKGETYKALDTFEKLSLRERRYVRETIARFFSTKTTSSQRLEQLELAFWIYPSRPAVRRLDKHLSQTGLDDEVTFYYHQLEQIADNDSFDHWWARGQQALRERKWKSAAEAFVNGLPHTTDEQETYWLLHGAEQAFRNLGHIECADTVHTFLEDVGSVPAANQDCMQLPIQR